MWFAPFALSLLLLQTTPPQTQPNFTGTWKMDLSRSESAHQAVPIGPVWLTIQQSDSTISIETKSTDARTSAVSSEVLNFNLDGKDSTSTGKAGQPVKVRARWDGDKLVAETEREVNESTITTHQIFHLSPSGKELMIDKTLNVQHGYQSAAMPKVTGRGKDVYVRTTSTKK